MTTELTSDDKATIPALLRDNINADRFPLSPRVQSWKSILAKLDPPARRPTAFLAPRPPGRAEHGIQEEAGSTEKNVIGRLRACLASP